MFGTAKVTSARAAGEWARQDSNLQPTPYEGAALPLSYKPGLKDCTPYTRPAMSRFTGLLVILMLAACGGAPAAPTAVPRQRAADISEVPILPAVSPAMRALYADGQRAGNNPRVFSKLGDCMTDNAEFLVPLAKGEYDLRQYSPLKPVIDTFIGTPTRQGKPWTLDSFASPSLAAAGGFNSAGPLDSTWADPQWCLSGETPLACEYRVTRPSIALIMFGTNDVAATEPEAYEAYLRLIVTQTLERKIVPVLHTFPTRPENPERSALLNQIVVKVATDTGVPLVNLNRALAALPNQGVGITDTTHLSIPPDGRVDVFSNENLSYGFTQRNLVTLQALEVVLRALGGLP